MTDLARRPSSDYDSFAYGTPDPFSSRARFRNALIASGDWCDGMETTQLLGLGQVMQMVEGRPLYSLYRLPLLGPIDPATERGLYVTALLDVTGHRYPFC